MNGHLLLLITRRPLVSQHPPSDSVPISAGLKASTNFAAASIRALRSSPVVAVANARPLAMYRFRILATADDRHVLSSQSRSSAVIAAMTALSTRYIGHSSSPQMP